MSRKAQYPKQTRFCYTRHDLHEEYSLSLEGKLYQHLSDEDVRNEDWDAVFTRKREKGVRIFLHMMRPEYVEECRLLFHKVYQAMPANKEITHKFATLFVYERCPAAIQSPTGQRKVAWAVFGEQVLDHCRKLPGGMEKKYKNWIACNEDSQQVLGIQATSSTVKSRSEHGGIRGADCPLSVLDPQSIRGSSVNPQIMAEVEQMLASRKTSLESVQNKLNAATVQLQEKSQSMWKNEGTSSAADVLQGQLKQLQTEQASMKGSGASDSQLLVIEAKIGALATALTALGADASNFNIREDVDRLEVCIKLDLNGRVCI